MPNYITRLLLPGLMYCIFISIVGCTNHNDAVPAIGRDSSWKKTSDLGGKPIRSLAINSIGYIFASTDGGVFRSRDNGNSWTKVNIGLSKNSVRAFAINSYGHIFAGTELGGVFCSKNDGDSWAQMNAGLTDTCVLALCINSSGQVFAGTGGGIFRSESNGRNWTQMNAGLPVSYARGRPIAARIISLTINSNGYVFAVAGGGGVFRSENNGDTWTKVNTGLSGATAMGALATNSSGHLFLAAGGVFRSVDDGNSWKQLNTGQMGPNLNTMMRASTATALAVSLEGTVFAGTSCGVLRSENNGDSWVVGLEDTHITALSVSLQGDIFSGTHSGGIFRSSTPAARRVRG